MPRKTAKSTPSRAAPLTTTPANNKNKNKRSRDSPQTISPLQQLPRVAPQEASSPSLSRLLMPVREALAAALPVSLESKHTPSPAEIFLDTLERETPILSEHIASTPIVSCLPILPHHPLHNLLCLLSPSFPVLKACHPFSARLFKMQGRFQPALR